MVETSKLRVSFPEANGGVREQLAAYAHEAWSGWMRYLFEKSVQHVDGSVTIPESFTTRWTRQLNTNYEDLSEDEKESDRAEADCILKIIEEEGVGEVGGKDDKD